MRLPLLSSLLFIAACGGASKPPDAPSTDTSSLESGPSSSAKDETPSAGPAATESTGTTAPSVPAEDAKARVTHPQPAVTGSIDGMPFAPKLAHVIGRMQKDGRVLLAIDEGTDCTDGGDATLTMLVPWQDGYKVDLGSLERSTKRGTGEIGFARVAKSGKKKTLSKTFKPSGTVTIVKAPFQENAVGQMKIDMQSGDYMLAGDLDIQVCVVPK